VQKKKTFQNEACKAVVAKVDEAGTTHREMFVLSITATIP
jgi:hypothetical protein